MPTHAYRQQIAIGGQVDNIMAGTPWVYAPRACRITIWASQVGAPVATPLLMDVMFGNAVYADGLGIGIGDAAAGLGPNKSRDHIMTEYAAAGDPIMIRLRNPGAVASDPCVLIDITF